MSQFVIHSFLPYSDHYRKFDSNNNGSVTIAARPLIITSSHAFFLVRRHDVFTLNDLQLRRRRRKRRRREEIHRHQNCHRIMEKKEGWKDGTGQLASLLSQRDSDK